MAISFVLIVGLFWIVVVLVAAYSSITIVEEGDLRALLVFGQMRTVLEPGINFTPPFISKTYPIDTTTMSIDKGNDRVDIPEEFESEVREAAGG